MQASRSQQYLLYNNLELFKSSYKLDPPQQTSWIALGNRLKIEQRVAAEPSIEQNSQHTWSEQFSCNPFIKTKQLFKNKNSNTSIMNDDLTNEHIFTAAKEEFQPPLLSEQHNFEFDSFGRHDQLNEKPAFPQKYGSNASSEGLKGWNSSSIQINFDKVCKEELVLPDPVVRVTDEDHIFGLTKIENSDESIKEFCFRLNETGDGNLEKTPVKKWSDNKVKVEKEAKEKKETIKNIILDFMDRLETIPTEELTSDFIHQTKLLLDSIGSSERVPLKQTQQTHYNDKYYDKSDRLKTVEDSSSTLRFFGEDSSKLGKTQRRQKIETSYKKNGKFKIYECNGKKENKTPVKSQSKTAKEKRFKF